VGEGDWVIEVYSPNTLEKTLSNTKRYTLAKQDLHDMSRSENRKPADLLVGE
jgi:hypothetical protein